MEDAEDEGEDEDQGVELPNIQINSIRYGDYSFPPDSNLIVDYVNGLKEGEGLLVSSQKKNLAKLHFHNDKLDGLCIFYDLDGHKINESVYKNGEVSEVNKLKDGVKKGKYVLRKSVMEEYDGDNLVYEGEFSGDMERGYVRNGTGTFFTSKNEYYSAVFDNGVEKKRIKEFIEDSMIEYDSQGKAYYKGGYEKDGYEFKRKGKGLLFEYDGTIVKDVFECEDGEKTIKRIEFIGNQMNEVNDNGVVIYQGGFEGSPRDGFVRNGEGTEYDERSLLVYSGRWRNGKKEGNGMYYENGDLRFEGNWNNDKPNGRGKCFNKKGEMIYDGEWKDGRYEIEGLKRYDFFSDTIMIETVSLCVTDFKDLKGLLNSRSVMVFVKELVIDEGVGNDYDGDILLCECENLERFVVNNNSLMNVNTLKISNNAKLKSIEIMDGGIWDNDIKTYKAPFEKVNTVVIESVFLLIID